jgi:hypothetical protein
MKDIPKHSFEEEFRKAFEEAEATPSPKLWAQIDADLANKEASQYKRKLYIYKLRVAAAAVIAFGFLGIWVLSSQFSGSSLADLPQQTNGSQSNTQTGNAPADGSVPETGTDTPALAQNSSTRSAENSPESASTESNHDNVLAGKNKLAGENNKQTQQSNRSRIAGNGSNISATAPEALALSSETEKVRKSANQPVKEKSMINPTTPAIAKNTNKAKSVAKEPATVLPAAPATKNQITEEEKNIALLPETTTTSPITPAANTPVATRTDFSQTGPAAGNFSAYTFSHINRQVEHLEDNMNLQAPSVRVKPNPNVYIEEEKEVEGGKSVSRWAVGLSFAPSQFNPNIQVNPQASASLSHVRNSYFNTAAPVSTGNTIQPNAVVGKELENAQSVNLSYNVGMNVNYALSKKFSLQSGLLYLYNQSQITTDNYLQNISNQEKYPEFMALIQPAASNSNNLQLYSDPLPASAPTMDAALQNITDRYATSYPGVTEVMVYNMYQYLSIPLSLHYKLIDKKVSTHVGAGVAADVFMKNTIGNPEENITNQEFNRNNNGPYRKMGFSGLVSAKVKYKISSRYSVYVEPSYRTALTPFTNSLIVSSRPNAFGIGTGFQYRF